MKTPIYAMNILLGILLAPLVLVMPVLSGGAQGKDEIVRLLSFKLDSLAMIFIVTGILLVFAQLNPGPATSISREGKCFWLVKNIPVPPGRQILGKFLAGYSISAAIALTAAIAILAVYGVSPVIIALSVLLSLVILTTTTSFSVMVDIVRPKLVWNNQQEAIKQNLNSLVAMLIGFLVIGVYAAVAVGFYLLKLPAALGFAAMAVLFAGASVGSVKLMIWMIEKKFDQMSI